MGFWFTMRTLFPKLREFVVHEDAFKSPVDIDDLVAMSELNDGSSNHKISAITSSFKKQQAAGHFLKVELKFKKVASQAG